MGEINLSKYECFPTREEYSKLCKMFLKSLVPRDIRKSKIPICKIFMGPPASGKSTLSLKDKNFVIIDADKIVDNLPQMIKLLKTKVKHGNSIGSCTDLAGKIAENIEKYCVNKKYNIATHFPYGPTFNFIYNMKQNKYIVKSYYVYAYDSYKNNTNRKALNLSKKVYLDILGAMSNYKNIFAAFKCSDRFKFVCYGKESIPATWEEVEKKLSKILSTVKKRIK